MTLFAKRLSKIILLTAVVGLLVGTSAQAQVFPPDFKCLRGDTLLWDLPTNTCGPFISYDIYRANDLAGPYTLIASVTDPSQTQFIDPNPSNETRWYFLRSNFDCPGQPVLSSDTLDNQPPETSPITVVTVVGDFVEIAWQPSPSPEVFAFIVYRNTPAGDIPIDTVFSGFTYTDFGAKPHERSESYFVNPLDRCGNTSLFDVRHRTIHLKADTEPCRQEIMLHWNLYEGWQQGIEKQEVLVRVDNGTATMAATLAAQDTSFVFQILEDGRQYCFTIRSTAVGGAPVSISNEVCLVADVVQPARELRLINATVNPDSSVTLSWHWNTDAELSLVEVLRSDHDGDFAVVGTLTPNTPLDPQPNYTDFPPAESHPWYYRIRTTDPCDSTKLSSLATTVFIQGTTAGSGLNHLSWTAPQTEYVNVHTWDLFRTVSGATTRIATLPGNILSYDDPFEPGLSGELTACYYVVARAVVELPDGSQRQTSSRSNVACIDQMVRIHAPNAFAPDGFNQEFRVLLAPERYQLFDLRIYNRYGQEVFHGSDPAHGWRGEFKGKELPQGVYVWSLRLRTETGEEIQRRGTVLLLR